VRMKDDVLNNSTKQEKWDELRGRIDRDQTPVKQQIFLQATGPMKGYVNS